MDSECLLMTRSFGESLRAAMATANLKPNELAAKAKIPAPRISSLQRTTHIPRQETLNKLSVALGISLAELLHHVMTPWGLPLCGEELSAAKGRDPAGPRPVKKRAG